MSSEPPIDRYVDCPACGTLGGWPHHSIITGETTVVECDVCEGLGSVERGVVVD